MAKDRTELCEVLNWELCQRSDCHMHGTCHKEAMMQPEPVQEVPDMSNSHFDGDRPACEVPEPSFEDYANMESMGHYMG